MEVKPCILNVRISRTMYIDLMVLARESGASVSDVVREALLLYLEENNDKGTSYEEVHGMVGRSARKGRQPIS